MLQPCYFTFVVYFLFLISTGMIGEARTGCENHSEFTLRLKLLLELMYTALQQIGNHSWLELYNVKLSVPDPDKFMSGDQGAVKIKASGPEP